MHSPVFVLEDGDYYRSEAGSGRRQICPFFDADSFHSESSINSNRKSFHQVETHHNQVRVATGNNISSRYVQNIKYFGVILDKKITTQPRKDLIQSVLEDRIWLHLRHKWTTGLTIVTQF